MELIQLQELQQVQQQIVVQVLQIQQQILLHIAKKQQRARPQSHALCYCISNSYASITSTIRSKISFTDPVACIALYLPS